MLSDFEIEGAREIPWHNLWWFSLTWILSWFVLLLINMWHNNTLIDAWFVLTHRKTIAVLNYCVLNVTVCERCLRSSTVSSVSVFHCFHVQPRTDTMYFEWFSLTLTPLPWCHDVFFLYLTCLLYTIMYACIPCARLAPLLLLSIFWIIMYFHVPYWCITM